MHKFILPFYLSLHVHVTAFSADVRMQNPKSHSDGRVKKCVPIHLTCDGVKTISKVCPVASSPNIVQGDIEIAPVSGSCSLMLQGSAAGAGDHSTGEFTCNVAGLASAAINCNFECDNLLAECKGQPRPSCTCEGGESIEKEAPLPPPFGILEYLACVVIVSCSIIFLWLFWRKDEDGNRGLRKLDWAGYKSTGDFRALLFDPVKPATVRTVDLTKSKNIEDFCCGKDKRPIKHDFTAE